ncbi:MAG: hypothetical protein P5702_04940 [Limnospira sp. PMC 1291.21]|uniref:hypothetical protein n=1 Tax=Limnospira TaxID=2596745 RepID=UPI001658A348|nr:MULTISPECIES: hypothetical protein [Limnospira]MDT9177082.1 hypothetical protein [Limnospira sp. PMC 1238.20]MDT9192299.1 hypothetical protein [Limnospira sp. PMC 1245.20]MDT9198689.1 hypothetical protein [Limnospira sp. PMC 1042.18]MDT9202663.1 hypothetical protein [Limnospira sp. PMC 1243.20]MDT9207601.1 hypothetical protein [Limnospira sp. PMC 1252.20]
MTAFERLHPWCLVRSANASERESVTNNQCLVVGRFRSQNDAVNHQRILQKLVPQAEYQVVYHPFENSNALTSKQV